MHALLSIEFHQVDPSKYAPFEEYLEEQKWRKRIRTTWTASFEDSVTYDSAVAMTKSEVAQAALVAGIRSSQYDAVLQVADNSAVEF